MRVTITTDPLRCGGLLCLTAMAVTVALSGCFVDETPENSGGGTSAVTDPPTTDTTSTSTTGPGTSTDSTSDGTQSGTTTSSMTGSTATTTTAATTATSTSEVTGESDPTNDPTNDPTEEPTGTSTTGADPCDAPTLELAMTTKCLPGTSLTSSGVGDELCAQEFGRNWRWLEFHDGEAPGWKAYGTWQTPAGAGERGWVWINDDNGHCWGSTRGMTWYRPEGDSCLASCAPATGLEGPEFDPLPGKCNPYDGDTPCELCRRLICVNG